MEQIAELNHSILAKLPLSIQILLKSLPLPDYSLLLAIVAVVIVSVFIIFSYSNQSDFSPVYEFSEPSSEKKEKQVKVKIPNTKKVRRGEKKKGKEVKAQPINEVSEMKENDSATGVADEEGWEKVLPKKPKRKDE